MDEARFVAEVAVGPAGRLLAGLWGALWGSFFNVVICRVPAGESLLRPASRCRACGAPIAWYDNVPLLSYLLLRGRCRRCGARFSPRYLLVEALVAGLAVAVHQVFVVDATGPIGLRLAHLIIGSLFCGLLIAVAFIDLDTLLIPNVITYPGIPVAVLLSLLMGNPHLWDGAVGAAGGYLLIRLFADGYRLIRGRLGMGYGDAKLLALICGLLGWQRLLPVLFLAAMQGSLIGIGALVWIRRRRRSGGPAAPSTTSGESEAEQAPPLRFATIPFGPFLGLAGIEVLLLHRWLARVFPMFMLG